MTHQKELFGDRSPDLDFMQLITPDIIPSIEGISSPYKLFRYDKGDQRYYFRFPEQGDAIGYLSVTEFTKKSLGIGVQLYKWAANNTVEYTKMYSEMRAAYGTQMHIEITDMLKSGKGNFDEIKNRAFNLAIDLGYKHSAMDWLDDMANDVASFLIMAREKNLKVIAAEFPICSNKYGLAGCIDLIVQLDFNRTRVNAMIDNKSGRKGFFEAHELQLHTYKKMWNDVYSSVFPVTHVFNFAPQNIKNKTKYKLQNQTSSVFAPTIEQRMSLANLEGWVNPPKGHMELNGSFEVETFDIADHLEKKSI